VAKITRMQQRRGLHRDLPLPLQPGEFGLTTDTRELFIGNDTTDALGGIQNKTVQVGNVVDGYSHAHSLLSNQIIEFTVKRSIIFSQTGIGPFTIQKIHSGLSALAAHASGVALETGINDQTLKIYKYSPANYNHKKLLPGDPDGEPIVQGDYNISGTNSLNLVQALVSNDIVYVVYLNKKDLENYLITEFNTDYDGAGSDLTDLTLQLSTDQLYFDESTGEGFIGLNQSQIPKVDNSTNFPLPNNATSASNKSIMEWLQEWISSASNKLNGAFVTLGSTFYSDDSLTGGKGIAKFGDDGTSTVPTYSWDSDLGFTTRSHTAAVNMSKFFNQSWLMEGSAPTRELSHLRSNIKVITETNTGDLWANVAIGNPTIRECGPTSASGTNDARGSQTMRPLGSSSLTNQGNLGSVFYDTSGTRSLEMDYVIEWYDGPVTYHVVRTGKATISMPMIAAGTNVYGYGLILDQWNEMNIMNPTGAINFAVGAEFDLGVIVSSMVTKYGDPVIVKDYRGASVQITNATQANPVVISSANHGFRNGDKVTISNVEGMTELNGNTYTVAGLSDYGIYPELYGTENTFELSGIDGTAFTAWSTPVADTPTAHGGALIDTAFNTKYGVTVSVSQASREISADATFVTNFASETQVFWADNDLTSSSYGKYFGFITYSNTRPVSAHIRFINKRF